MFSSTMIKGSKLMGSVEKGVVIVIITMTLQSWHNIKEIRIDGMEPRWVTYFYLLYYYYIIIWRFLWYSVV